MTITERRAGDALVLTLTGDIDGFTATDVESDVLRRIAAGNTRLVIDLSGTHFISSVGLGALIQINKRVAAAGGKVCFCGLNEQIHRLFEISGMYLLIDVKPSCADALASLATA